MKDYKSIYETALLLNPDRDLEKILPISSNADELIGRTDAWYLSIMSRRIFRAGLKHSMVDAKWPEFENVFHGFDIHSVRMMSDDDLDGLMTNTRIIRHWRKIHAVRYNASVMYDQINQTGRFGRYIAEWPVEDIVDLWREIAKNFKQMGGYSAPYFLRMAGKDTFILTRDVVRALNRWGAYQGVPTSVRAKQQVQHVFNTWAAESGRPLCQLSRILALSVNE